MDDFKENCGDKKAKKVFFYALKLVSWPVTAAATASVSAAISAATASAAVTATASE
jgi:hypothetical protein